MAKFFRLVQNEFLKLLYHRSVWVLLGSWVVLFTAIAAYTKSSISSAGHLKLTLYAFGSSSGLIILFFVVWCISSSITRELHSGTINLIIIKPISRWKILLSKYLMSIFFSISVYIYFLSVTSIIFLIFTGSFNIEPLIFKQAVLPVLINLILLWAPVTLLISVIMKSAAQCTSVSIAVFFIIFPMLQRLQINFGLYENVGLLINNLHDLSTGSKFYTPLLISLAYDAIIIAASIIIFNKKDIGR